MTTPQLRIVLVDNDHSRRMSIEKSLGHMGYHRVLPIESLTDLFVLLDNAIVVFDLVIINESIALTAGWGLEQALRDCSCVKYSLVYKAAELNVEHSLFSTCHFTASGVPDRPILAQVMNRIEGQQITARAARLYSV